MPESIKSLFPCGLLIHRLSVIFLPAVLAAATTDSSLIQWDQKDYTILFRIKETLEFDEEWFYTIYDLIQGYCWVNQTLVKA